jgi:hypothetical protein
LGSSRKRSPARQRRPSFAIVWAVSGLCALLANSALLRAQPIDVRTIVQRSVAANQADWRAAPDYDYFERDRDSSGGTKTYRVHMILGSPYQQLVRVNGEPLPADQQGEEQRKLEETIAQRRSESPEERAQRVAEYEKERKRDQLMLDQLSVAFNFTFAGERNLGSRRVYVLRAIPRPGYNPPNRDTQVLTGMKGTLWIDTSTFQWVKVQAQVIQPVSIVGFLAEVEPGTHFELDYAPVEDGIWLPTRYVMKSKARVLFFFTTTRQADETYFGYQKAAPVTRGDPAGSN